MPVNLSKFKNKNALKKSETMFMFLNVILIICNLIRKMNHFYIYILPKCHIKQK